MLTTNQTAVRITFLGGALGGVRPRQKGFVANALAFGQRTSIPQGYTDPEVALVSTIQTSESGAWRGIMRAGFEAQAHVGQQGSLDLQAEADLTMTANTRQSSSLDLVAEADLTMSLAQSMQMSLPMDILARPSAFDIAQEVWNGAASGYNGAGTMGKEVQDGKKAAKLAAALSA